MRAKEAAVFLLIAGVAFNTMMIYHFLVDGEDTIIGRTVDTDTAIINLSIDQVIAINFTSTGLSFGTGSVQAGNANCTIITNGSGTGTNCALFENTNDQYLTVRNTGNNNISLNVSFADNASTFIGGTSPAFQLWWNYTAGSCTNTTGHHLQTLVINSTTDANWWGNYSVTDNQWHDINATQVNDYALCNNMLYNATNELYLYFLLTLPSDSSSGNLSTTITATGYTT